MSMRSRPSASRRTKVAIALAALLGLLGGIAIYHSQSAPSAQSAEPPLADMPGTGDVPPSVPHASHAAPAVTTTIAPRAGNGADASVTTSTLTSGPLRSRSDQPSTAVELLNAPPRRGRFRISGIPSGRLAPGRSALLNLVLTNPNAFPITVRSLTVRMRTISAPRASLGLSCSSPDFTVAQFAGGGLRLRAASTTSLGRMGVARALWPRVSMPDRAVDQDGCKGASLTLDYRGVGR
ncbi:MAG: hypothetical protein M3O90_07690 [Actinomycetota bacterium]|nr:hypothetical protein [Actinomycetota bacterium]